MIGVGFGEVADPLSSIMKSKNTCISIEISSRKMPKVCKQNDLRPTAAPIVT